MFSPNLFFSSFSVFFAGGFSSGLRSLGWAFNEGFFHLFASARPVRYPSCYTIHFSFSNLNVLIIRSQSGNSLCCTPQAHVYVTMARLRPLEAYQTQIGSAVEGSLALDLAYPDSLISKLRQHPLRGYTHVADYVCRAMKLGLFGGSFDPVHLGHLLAARAALEEAALARIFFIPAAQSPFKPALLPAPPALRLRCLRLALAGDSSAEIDDREIRRGGISFTIDTVRAYAREFPGAELFYLIGADQVGQLPLWREAGDLARLVQFLIIPRPGEAGFTVA